MSKPLPNRNREKGANPVERLAPRISPQLVKRGCAQKELNLQPAGYKRHGNGRVIVFPLRGWVDTQDESPRAKPEAPAPDRNGSVTEPITFLASGHKAVGSIEGGTSGAAQVRGDSTGTLAGKLAGHRQPSDLDSQQPYALSGRPDILGFLEGVTLAAAMGAVKVWR